MEELEAELGRLLTSIEYRLPSREDYGLPTDSMAALREVEQLTGTLAAKDHGERVELGYLKFRIHADANRHRDAAHASQDCLSEATRSFFSYGSKGHTLWLQLRWRRIRALGEQANWLAFERALSELIGNLAGSSRRHDRDHDLDLARRLRALVYQVRALETEDPQTTAALLAESLRELEKLPEGDERETAIEATRRRMSQSEQGAAERAPSATEVTSPDPIGLLTFRDFSPASRKRFLEKSDPDLDPPCLVIPERSPHRILWVLGLFLFFGVAIATGLGGIFGFPSVIGFAATLPLIVTSGCGIRIARDLVRFRRQRAAGALGYGFRIDGEKLLVRTLEAFSDSTYFYGKNAVHLPLERIHHAKITLKPIYAMAGRMRKAKQLTLNYLDDAQSQQRIDVRDSFELPVTEINARLQRLNHNLVGTWKDAHSDATLHFDSEAGTYTDVHGSAHAFRWQEIEGQALEIIPLEALPDADAPQAGLCRFEIETKGSAFELTFFGGFAGTTSRRLERVSKATDVPMNPTRIANRLAAIEPLPELMGVTQGPL